MLPVLSRERARRPFSGIRSGIDRLFDEFVADGGGGPGRVVNPNAFTPALDMRETDTSLVVEVEVPGLKPSEVSVRIEDGVLVLRGERAQVQEQKTRQWHRSERIIGRFVRRIPLPDCADVGKVDATCKDGVLVVTLAKKPDAKPKAITVRVK